MLQAVISLEFEQYEGMTCSREEDASWLEMQIHEVKGNPTLEITVNMTEGHLISDVTNSQIGKGGFGDGFIYGLVLFYSSKEVLLGGLPGHVFVVGITRTSLQGDVGGYYGRIITD